MGTPHPGTDTAEVMQQKFKEARDKVNLQRRQIAAIELLFNTGIITVAPAEDAINTFIYDTTRGVVVRS